VREWLLQQAAAGMLDHVGGQRFELNQEQAIVIPTRNIPPSWEAFLVSCWGCSRMRGRFRTWWPNCGAAAADVGCGSGTSRVLMGRAFPNSEFHGYDNSTHAIEAARGVPNAQFHLVRAEGLPEANFDLVTTFDVVHDTTNPAGVVAGIARALKPDGTWIASDINGFASPEENLEKHEMAHVLYGFSVMCCMRASRSRPPLS